MNRTAPPLLSLALFGLLCVIWASTWTAIKIGLNETGAPLLFAGARFLLAGAALLPLLRLYPTRWDRRLWSDAWMLGVFLIALPYGLVYIGEQYTESYLPAVVMAILPINVALLLLSRRENVEPITPLAMLGLALSFGGVLLTLWDRLSVRFQWMQLFAVGLIFCATFSTAGATIYARSRAAGPRLLPLLALELLIGGGLLCLAGLLLGENPARFPLTAKSIGVTLYLAVPGSSLAWWIYLYLNQHWGSTRTSTTVFFTPGLAIFFGWLLLGEGLSGWVVVGTGVLVMGIWLFRKGRGNPAVRRGPPAA